MRKTLYDYCVETGKTDLLESFNDSRSAPDTPASVSCGSKRKVWWRCEKGHEWFAEVRARARGAGCPYCAGKLPAAGETDLAATRPELAAQWDGRRNAPLTPSEVSAGSERRVWWLCERGHSWSASVLSRAHGAGCPVCAGKKVSPGENDLASRFPRIAAQWHPTKNGDLTARALTPASSRKVWWLCPEGHAYEASAASRTAHGTGCPYCAGRKVLAGFNDLATLEPKLAAQWHPTLNGELRPDRVTAGSSRKVWWRCAEGHAWQAVIHSRAAGRCACPVCSGRVKQPPHRYRRSAAPAASVHDG